MAAGRVPKAFGINHPVGGSNPSPGATFVVCHTSFIYSAANQHRRITSAKLKIFFEGPYSIMTLNITAQSIPNAMRDPGSVYIASGRAGALCPGTVAYTPCDAGLFFVLTFLILNFSLLGGMIFLSVEKQDSVKDKQDLLCPVISVNTQTSGNPF